MEDSPLHIGCDHWIECMNDGTLKLTTITERGWIRKLEWVNTAADEQSMRQIHCLLTVSSHGVVSMSWGHLLAKLAHEARHKALRSTKCAPSSIEDEATVDGNTFHAISITTNSATRTTTGSLVCQSRNGIEWKYQL